MPDHLGLSVYLSSFEAQREMLSRHAGQGAAVFLSLHISEEFGPDYCRRAESACRWLHEAGFRIIADVSVKTQQQFGEPDLVRLAQRLHIWALRIDYGLAEEEILRLAKAMPIVVNASTTTREAAEQIAAQGKLVMAMHNFYPRPETGLDEEFLLETTKGLQNAGLKVLAFIPGDTVLRGPLGEGLPTLEAHRGQLPSAAFADLKLRFGMDGIFLGDPGISEEEADRIGRFCRDGILSIPADLEEDYAGLYGQVFTCRVDSPKWMIRFQESRVYSCKGQTVEPGSCLPRDRGCITIDNVNYGRYTGEIMMIRSQLKAEPRVNVIGMVPEKAWPLMDRVCRGGKFMLVRPEVSKTL